jgi:hypothetical protein
MMTFQEYLHQIEQNYPFVLLLSFLIHLSAMAIQQTTRANASWINDVIFPLISKDHDVLFSLTTNSSWPWRYTPNMSW